MHSFVLIRHGAIISEGYWAPYTEDSLQRMYSATKSFAGVAVGLLAQDGYIHLDDPVIQYFPDKVVKQPHPYMEQMTIRDLLKMCTVHTRTATQIVPHPDLLKAFFNVTPSHRSGTVFNYDTGASVVLSALVERLTKLPLLEYLRMKALGKIGFSDDAFIQKIGSVSHGGSGLLCTSHDLAKFALLCMQQGNWFGFQLLPKDFMRLATSKQVDTHFAQPGHGAFGYGYQFWMTENNGFALYGMGGQLAICLPEKNLVLVTTGDTMENPGGIDLIFRAFWDTIYADLHNDSLPEDEEASAQLYERIAALKIPYVKGESDSPIALSIGGKRFQLDENPSVYKELCVGFGPDFGILDFTTDSGSHELRFGFGHNVHQVFPEAGYECQVSGAWVDYETLFIKVYITDQNLGALHILLHFGQDGSITISSRSFGDTLLNGYDACVTGYVYE
ncbi:MAG: serine hydrolase [Firmicutes bacterium]|nr:serine hydrolase [Bacillota bacterium]